MNGHAKTDEETLRRALLAQRLAAVSTLAEELAHEVHNPLNCALLQLAVLERRLTQPDCRPAALQPVAQLVEDARKSLNRSHAARRERREVEEAPFTRRSVWSNREQRVVFVDVGEVVE
jgi:signal transduction histidine kinase